MKKPIVLISLMTVLACGQSTDYSMLPPEEAGNLGLESKETLAEESGYGADLQKSNALAYNSENDYQDEGNSQAPASKDAKKIIRTARISLEVKDYPEARKKVDEILKNHDAFIASESEQNSYYRLENNLKIRILPDQLDACILALENIALNIDNKTITTEDVTRQFVDLETRLATKRAVVDQYRALLQKAQKIEEILAVEEKIRVVVEEIESVEGQLRYLRDQVGYSTIELHLYETIETAPRQKHGFFAQLGKAFVRGWGSFQDLVIGLVSIWPVMLIIGGIVFWLFRLRRRRRKSSHVQK